MEAKVVRWGEDLVVKLPAAEAEELGIRGSETVEVSKPSSEPQQWRGRRYLDGLPVSTMAEMIAEAQRLGPASEPPIIARGSDRGSEIIDDLHDPYRPAGATG